MILSFSHVNFKFCGPYNYEVAFECDQGNNPCHGKCLGQQLFCYCQLSAFGIEFFTTTYLFQCLLFWFYIYARDHATFLQPFYLFIWVLMSLSATVKVISRWVVLYAEETKITAGQCSLNRRSSVSNHQLSIWGLGFELQTSEVGGECPTAAPLCPPPPPPLQPLQVCLVIQKFNS